MAEADKQAPPEDEADSLEGGDDNDSSLETPVENNSGVIDATGGDGGPSKTVKRPDSPYKPPGGLKNRLKRFNLYILLFVFILVAAAGIVTIAYIQSKKASVTSTLQTQQLTQQALQQVAASDATVGSSQQILNIQSSAVFAGKVLIRDGLEVAGSLSVGGTTALSDLAVSGTSQFGQAQINKNLSVAGDTGLQGSVTVAKSLQVNGSGSFGGSLTAPQITTSSIQLNGDLVLTHHLIIGGATPSRSNGAALGGGGTVSVSGSDTGGSISINTGSSPAAGCFVSVNFSSRYGSTPHVLITPVGSSAAVLDYYVNRSTTSFSVCDATVPPSGASFDFDYFVID